MIILWCHIVVIVYAWVCVVKYLLGVDDSEEKGEKQKQMLVVTSSKIQKCITIVNFDKERLFFSSVMNVTASNHHKPLHTSLGLDIGSIGGETCKKLKKEPRGDRGRQQRVLGERGWGKNWGGDS